MARHLLDTNHLSAALNSDPRIRQRLLDLLLRGERVGTCVPVLCELQAGIVLTIQRQDNEQLLRQLLQQIRVWPLDTQTAILFGELYHELRRAGRVLSQVDIMLAALARQMQAVVISTDRDFDAVAGIRRESWLDA